MAGIIPNLAPATGDRASGAQVIEGSLKFSGTTNTSLRKAFHSADRRRYTVSVWVKPDSFDENNRIFNNYTDGSNYAGLYFRDTPDFQIAYAERLSGNFDILCQSRAMYREPGWYHIVLAVDTTLSTSSDRVLLYVNGVREDLVDVYSGGFNPSVGAATFPSQNYQTQLVQSTGTTEISPTTGFSNGEWEGQMSQFYYIDGQQLTADNFGFRDPLTNTWRPKKFEEDTTTANDGTTWSSGSITGTSGGSAVTISTPGGAFDGDTSTSASFTHVANNDSILTWNPQKTIHGKRFRIYVYQPQGTSGANMYLKTNNGGYVSDSSWAAVSANATGWSDYISIPDGGLESISIKLTYGGASTQEIHAIEVDDVILIDNVVQRRKIRPNPNDGTTWSDGIDSTRSGDSADKGFDGNPGSNAAVNDTDMAWTVSLSNVTSMAIRCREANGTGSATLTVSGTGIEDLVVVATETGELKPITVTSPNVSNLTITTSNQGALAPGIAQVVVNGYTLIDDAVDNSFYLPMDGSAPIGHDKLNPKPINNGTFWSNATVSGSGSIDSSYPLSNSFNGTITGTNTRSSSANTDITITLPEAIPFTKKIRIYQNQNGTAKINSESTVNTSSGGANWVTVYSGSGTFSSLTLTSSGGDTVSLYAVEVDGEILNDGIYGNGFTPVNFGGSVELDKATGALPILNTTQGGTQAGVDVRPDGVNYSSNTTASGGFNSSYPKTNLFDGRSPADSNRAEADSNDDAIDITFSPAINVSSTISLWSGKSSTRYQINNSGSYTTYSDAVGSYKDISHSGSLSNLKILHGSAGQAAGISAIKIDGTQLVDNNGLVFAAPLVGNADDICDQINSSSTAKAATVNGATATAGFGNFYNTSFKFDGTDDYITWGSNTDWKFLSDGTTDYTMETWIRATSTYGKSGRGYILFNTAGTIGSGENGMALWLNSSSLRFQICVGGGIQTIFSHSYTLPADKWVHLALVNDGGDFGLFIDGIRVASNNSYSTWNSNNPGITLNTGRTTDDYYFNDGYMQDMRIYKSAKYTRNFIPASTNPDILPDTPSGVSGGSKLTKITEGAVSFDGSGDYMDVSASSDFAFGTGDFTVECFIYSGVNSVDTFYRRIYMTDGPTGNASGNFQISVAPTTGTINLWENTGDLDLLGTTNVTNRRWNHIAAVRSGTTLKIYVNGIEEASTTYSTSVTANSGSPRPRIGNYNGSTNQGDFDGFISNLRVIKGTALYTSNFTPPTEPLTNVTNTKLLCCQSNTQAGAAAASPNLGGINDGTIWTEMTSTSGNYSQYQSQSPSNLFDGDTGDGWQFSGTTASAIFTPTGGISYSSQVRVYIGATGNIANTQYKINSGSYQSFASSGAQWLTILSGSGTFTRFELYQNGDPYTMAMNAIEVDGVILKDPVSVNGDAAAINFNPFTTDINTVRGQETGYCTWNPLVGTGTLSDGNLKFGGANNWKNTDGTISFSSGKWYYEGTYVGSQYGSAQGNIAAGIGFKKTTAFLPEGSNAEPVNSADYRNNTIAFYQNGYFTDFGTGTGTHTSIRSQITAGDVVGVSIDLDNGSYEFYLNGISITSGTVSYAGELVPWAEAYYANAFVCNFGQKPFKFPPPDGFQPLNVANIRPETVIANPTQYVGVTTYSGNEGTQTIGGLAFSPDLIWIKERVDEVSHYVGDTVNGVNKSLQANSTNTQTTDHPMGYISTTTRDGFTLVSGASGSFYVNGNPEKYVAWCWKAGGNRNTFNVDDVGYSTAAAAGMSAGALNNNSAVYDASQTWRSYMSNSSGAGNLFDGDLSTFYGPDGNTQTFTPTTAITVRRKLEIYYKSSSTSRNASVNGGSTIATGTSGNGKWVDLQFTGMLREISVTNGWNVSAIRIDGKILVDDDVTPENRPLIAPSGASAGTKQGFSIITYSGTNDARATIPTGLNEETDFAIVKATNGTYNWYVYHSSLASSNRMILNTTAAQETDNNGFIYRDGPGLLGLNRGSALGNNVNASTINYVAYAWHDVPGLQKFGSFEGNEDADGPFVELGFRPALILLRNIDNSGTNYDWCWYDNERGKFNPNDKFLIVNEGKQENRRSDDNYDNARYVDFLGNGFKIRNNSSPVNLNAHTIIYAAWAEAPAINLYGAQSNAR